MYYTIPLAKKKKPNQKKKMPNIRLCIFGMFKIEVILLLFCFDYIYIRATKNTLWGIPIFFSSSILNEYQITYSDTNIASKPNEGG